MAKGRGYTKAQMEAAQRRFPSDMNNHMSMRYGYLEGLRINREVERMLRLGIKYLEEGDARLNVWAAEARHAIEALEGRRAVAGNEQGDDNGN